MQIPEHQAGDFCFFEPGVARQFNGYNQHCGIEKRHSEDRYDECGIHREMVSDYLLEGCAMSGVSIRFGTDGWRAVMCDTFTFANVSLVCQALAQHILEAGRAAQGVIVAYDARFLGEQFALQAAEVLLGNGIPVWLPQTDVPTPVVAHAVVTIGAAGAVMFTASHNPPEYNGIKFIPHYGGPATPEITTSIEQHLSAVMHSAQSVKQRTPAQAGSECRALDPRPAYVEHIRGLVDLPAVRAAGITIGYDAMHGSGRNYVAPILADAGIPVVAIRCTRDPLFGGSAPEPKADHLAGLMELVRGGHAQLGLATDGDADRFGIIDSDGAYLTPNEVISLLIPYLVTERGMRGAVVRTVATTHLIDRLAAHFQLAVYETPVGFKHICDRMRQEPVVIGGEESGGLSIGSHIPEKDGILAGLLVAEVAAKTGLPLGSMLRQWSAKVGPAQTRRIDIVIPEEAKSALLANLCQQPPAKVGEQRVQRVLTIDGAKYLLEDGSWLLVRASGTEPVVRIYLEAPDALALQNLEHNARTLVEEVTGYAH